MRDLNKNIAILLDYLQGMLDQSGKTLPDISALDEDFQPLADSLLSYCRKISQVKELADSLAQGNLDLKLPPPSNEFAAPLKALHAKLRHLTWQSQQIAAGDFQQRVDFMGDFSRAFNSMTARLDEQRRSLLFEIEKSQRKSLALKQSNILLQSIAAKLSQWIIVIDAQSGQWVYSNQEIGQVMKGYQAANVFRQWLEESLPKIQAPGQADYESEVTIECGDQIFLCNIHEIEWNDSDAFVFLLTDISQETLQINELQNKAYIDPLTQVYNRNYGMKLVNNWLEDKAAFLLCFIDIDNLKFVNDLLGHLEGDKYICQVANQLKSLASTGIVTRLGGDEFMLLLPGWASRPAIKRLELVRTRLISDSLSLQLPFRSGISYGIVQVGHDNDLSISQLLSQADHKMYQYKWANKNRPSAL